MDQKVVVRVIGDDENNTTAILLMLIKTLGEHCVQYTGPVLPDRTLGEVRRILRRMGDENVMVELHQGE